MTVKRIGMVKNDIAGASPDGLVGDDGLVEVKCPRRHHFIRMVLSDDPAADYRWQVLGQLWLSERKWCDVCLYSPPCRCSFTAWRRPKAIGDALAEAVAEFAADVDAACAEARRRIFSNQPLDEIEQLAGANPWRNE